MRAVSNLSTSRDPCRAAPIRPELKVVIYEFAWPIYEFELKNSDFRAVWNAACNIFIDALSENGKKRNKRNNSKINIITTAVSVPLNLVSSVNW